MIFTTFVESTLTYDSAVWIINIKIEDKIHFTEIMFWRICWNVTIMDSIRRENQRKNKQTSLIEKNRTAKKRFEVKDRHSLKFRDRSTRRKPSSSSKPRLISLLLMQRGLLSLRLMLYTSHYLIYINTSRIGKIDYVIRF